MMIFIRLLLLGTLLSSTKPAELKITLYNQHKVWKDSSAMQFKIRLINQSEKTVSIPDQAFDDVYTDKPSPLYNLIFIVQQLNKGKYEPYRDRPIIDYVTEDERTPKECLDSVAKIRNPFIELKPHDSLYLDYSFMLGRYYRKGKYRIKVDFTYEFTRPLKWVGSEWVYFEVANDLYRPSPRDRLTTPIKLFWQRNNSAS
jgi:hypothetical protein